MEGGPNGLEFVFDELDVLATNLFQKGFGAFLAEFRVAGLNADEESVVGKLGELLGGEERVVQAGQAHEGEQAEKRGEGAEQDGQLKHNREEGWERPDVGRLGLDDGGIGLGELLKEAEADAGPEVGLGEGLEDESHAGAGHAADEDELGKDGLGVAHGLVHAVDGEGAVDVPALITGIADVLGGVVEVGRAIKFGEVSVDSFQGAHLKNLK